MCFPNLLPTKYANVSLSHADSSAVKIIKNTCDCWNRSGRLRQRFLSRVIVDITYGTITPQNIDITTSSNFDFLIVTEHDEHHDYDIDYCNDICRNGSFEKSLYS